MLYTKITILLQATILQAMSLLGVFDTSQQYGMCGKTFRCFFNFARIFCPEIFKNSSFYGFLRQKICLKLEKRLKVFPHVLYCQEVSNTPNSYLAYNIEAQYGVFSCIPTYIRFTSLFTVWAVEDLSAMWLICAMQKAVNFPLLLT